MRASLPSILETNCPFITIYGQEVSNLCSDQTLDQLPLLPINLVHLDSIDTRKLARCPCEGGDTGENGALVFAETNPTIFKPQEFSRRVTISTKNSR